MMKFLKFWWRHSLGEITITLFFFIAWGWMSGHLHWWWYARWAGENHTNALTLTVFSWFALALLMIFVVYPLWQYFAKLWDEYQKTVSHED